MSDFPNLGTGAPSTPETIADLRRLFGQQVLLLPVRFGQKCPILTGWQKLTADKMSQPDYLHQLVGKNVGVSLGKVSGGLVTIDFDDDVLSLAFSKENPKLQNTLISRAHRGQNFWLNLQGPYPNSFKIKSADGRLVGEFRADGNQTVIHGRHPKGVPYQPHRRMNCQGMVIDPPVVTMWEEINWPDGLVVPPKEVGQDEYDALTKKFGKPVYFSPRGALTIGEPFHVGQFLKEHPIVFWRGHGFYEYAPHTGLWSEITSDRVKRLFSDDLLRYSEEARCPDLAGKRNDNLLRSLLAQTKSYGECEFESHQNWDLIHLRNGMLDISQPKPELLVFDPAYYSTNAIPFDYDPDAKCPRFLEMLNAALPAEDVDLILRWIGMVLTGQNFGHKILLLVGAGGAGKGTLAEIVSYLVGEKNCGQLRTAQLQQRFEIGRYAGKTLLIGADVPGDFLNRAGAQVLKSLTGGDLLTCEKKKSNGVLEVRGTFNIVINSNQRLRVRLDGDHGAWARRLLIVDFKKGVKKVIPNFARTIVQSEASGIINEALSALHRLRAQYDEQGGFGLSDQQKQRVERLLSESDSIRAFHEQKLTRSEGSEVTTEELYTAYEKFCYGRGWVPHEPVVFKKDSPQLILEFFGVTQRHDIERNGYPKRGYGGVAITDSADEWE